MAHTEIRLNFESPPCDFRRLLAIALFTWVFRSDSNRHVSFQRQSESNSSSEFGLRIVPSGTLGSFLLVVFVRFFPFSSSINNSSALTPVENKTSVIFSPISTQSYSLTKERVLHIVKSEYNNHVILHFYWFLSYKNGRFKYIFHEQKQEQQPLREPRGKHGNRDTTKEQ